MEPKHLYSSELRTVLSLATIFSSRMLGLFIILPVFALYANQFHAATPTLIGLALGIYGFTQALSQMPLGMLSDRIGRKPVIISGLIIFIAGSIVAALSHSIYGIIIGRALQGVGAVGSTLMALLADVTKVENRTKAMAVLGMTIALSFMAAIIIGPILSAYIGLSGLFWVTAGLGFISIILLITIVPSPTRINFHNDTEANTQIFKTVIKNTQLLRLNISIFMLHAILTASFIAVPILISQLHRISEQHQWMLYLPVLFIAFSASIPFIIIAEKKRQMRAIFFSATAVLGLTQLLLYFIHNQLTFLIIMLVLFFTAFTLLEAILPSWISKVAPINAKGTAIGFFSSSQFFGIFIGGALGGWIYSHFALSGIFLFCTLLTAFWLLAILNLHSPPYLKTVLLETGTIDKQQAQTLTQTLQQVSGVAEVVISIKESIAYLKIDNQKSVDIDKLKSIIAGNDSRFPPSRE